MKKKILSLILALLMASSSAAMAAADEVLTTAAPSENATHLASAEFLNEQKIMLGKSEGEIDYALNDNVKRYEMALFVARISMGGEWLNDEMWWADPATSAYTDLANSGAIKVIGALNFATKKGIIEGFGNGEFGPEEPVTYQDALTMVVRTLGFTGLDWPWEYIEKAIDLGLTKDVADGKSYTAPMTRGEVAQLIYNALSTTKKDGNNLAAEVFNMKEAAIIITASDRVVFEQGAAVAPAGKVAFKEYDLATGAIGTKTYYAPVAEFAFTGNDANAAVGHLYKALLSTDDNGNITADKATGLTVEKIMEASYLDTISNRAYQKVKGEDGKVIPSAIEAALKEIKLASKYTRAADEVVVYSATNNAVSSTTIGGVAMDWVTGDILQECSKDDADVSHEVDGKYYKVAWFYNETLNKYFRVKKDAANNNAVGFEWLEDEELKAIVETLKQSNTTVQAVTLLKEIKDADTAYADLVLEKFGGEEGKALQGTYQTYKLGYLKNEKKKCTGCDAEKAGIRIYDVLSEMEILDDGENGYGSGTKLSADPVVAENTPHTTKSGCTNASVWSTTPIPTKDCYVIYSYNEVTKELKIVEQVQTVKGVLRAYSTRNELVLIDDKKLDLGYDELLGASFSMNAKSEKAADKAIVENYLNGLDGLLNEYVECAIVADRVVAMRTVEKNVDNERYLIMQDYVGNTKNGEMVVEAYAASTGKLNRYVIDSFDDVAFGTRKYETVALNEVKAEAQFATGSLYYVSYMDGNRVEVEKFGGYENGVFTYDDAKIATTSKSISFTADGYKVTGGKDDNPNEGTYVIISSEYVEGRAPIFVYSGEVYDTDWEIRGTVLKNVTGADVFVDVTKMTGFALDAHLHGMYLYEGGKIYDAAYSQDYYEGLFGEETDALVPTEQYMVVELVDLYTGKTTVETLRNIEKESLKAGKVYVTIEGDNGIQSVQTEWDSETFIADMADVFYKDTFVLYNNKNTASADYLFGTFTSKKAPVAGDIAKAVAADGYFSNAAFVKLTAKNLESYVVRTDANGNVTLEDLTAFYKANKGAEVECTYVYNVANSSAVVYAVVTKEAPAETEAPETNAPETNAPETNAPETNAPETNAPETNAPETNAPETNAPETNAPETNAPETNAPETNAPETEAPELVSIEVAVSIASTEEATSFALANVAYDDTLLVFKGIDNDLSDCDALAKNMFGAESAVDFSLNTIMIASASMQGAIPIKLEGKLCDLVFEVKEGADPAAALAAAENVKFDRVIIKNTSTEINTCTFPVVVTPIYAD